MWYANGNLTYNDVSKIETLVGIIKMTDKAQERGTVVRGGALLEQWPGSLRSEARQGSGDDLGKCIPDRETATRSRAGMSLGVPETSRKLITHSGEEGGRQGEVHGPQQEKQVRGGLCRARPWKSSEESMGFCRH